MSGSYDESFHLKSHLSRNPAFWLKLADAYSPWARVHSVIW